MQQNTRMNTPYEVLCGGKSADSIVGPPAGKGNAGVKSLMEVYNENES